MKREFTISVRDWRRLRERALRAQRKDQSEVCGALVQNAYGDLGLGFLRNIAAKSGSFEMERSEISRLRRDAKLSAGRIAGYFHSHPIGDAVPGQRDIVEAPAGSLMLVHDVCGCEARLWRVVKRKIDKYVIEQALQIR